ncbi:uncharacterized protein LOC134811573 [Bolinopsis microptera]|uniref:uncharacterized protein LOC134811573 n=1 Tax=Bolinopsis microptera TaxID=2820187 RepID=UPI003078D9BA
MEIDLYSWPSYFDNEGRLLDEYKLRKTSFFHGLSDDIRREAWPVMLSLWDRDSTSLIRHTARDKMLKEYEHLRNGWINAQPELFDREMKQSIKTIGKDVRRTERQHPYFAEEDGEGLRMLRRILITLSAYDTEVSYVQGMNEIVAPILLTLQEESLTFWCFVKLMPLLRDRLLTLDISPQLSSTADLVQYFDSDLYLHIEQLTGGHWLFCFRWYLLMFKNEFKTEDILRLWDVLFSQHNTAHFEIFIGTSIILMHKEEVLACGTSDQLLHFAQSVTAKLNVGIVINYARDLSVKIASTEGLSDNLAALVKQVDKVPPPLVGFVRRRQCFQNVYSGRQHMNDDLIKSLMSLNTSQTAPRTTPLFFNCTEASVPIPTQNYLAGIQGVQPLTLAETPQLAPPPTDAQLLAASASMSNPRSRQRRPDALYKDSVSAGGSAVVGQAPGSGHYDNSAQPSTEPGAQHSAQPNVQHSAQPSVHNSVQRSAQQYGTGAYSGQYEHHNHQYDYSQGYNPEHYANSQQYHVNNQEYHLNNQEYYANNQEYYANNEEYYASNQEYYANNEEYYANSHNHSVTNEQSVYQGSDNNVYNYQDQYSYQQQGHPVQQQGHPAQQQEHPVQQQGHPVQQQGHPAQQQEHPVQQQGHPVQQQEHPVQQQGHPVQQQGHQVQQQGLPVQQHGHPVQQQGHPVQQQGHPVQQQGHPVQQQGHQVQQQGHPAQQQGHPAQQQGHPAQQQGHPVQQQGLPVQQHGHQVHNFHNSQHQTSDPPIEASTSVDNISVAESEASRSPQSENVPQNVQSVKEDDDALSKISDDFWDMGISVHSNEALS